MHDYAQSKQTSQPQLKPAWRQGNWMRWSPLRQEARRDPLAESQKHRIARLLTFAVLPYHFY